MPPVTIVAHRPGGAPGTHPPPTRPPGLGYPLATMLPIETIRTAPKVLLHDHLDGGLRPETVIELAGPAHG